MFDARAVEALLSNELGQPAPACRSLSERRLRRCGLGALLRRRDSCRA